MKNEGGIFSMGIPRLVCLSMVSLLMLSVSISGKTKVKQLQIRTQLQGWKEQKDTFNRFSGNKLYELINGGATEYLQQGLLEGIHQQFFNDQGKTVEVFVEDFGTEQNSQKMFSVKKEGFSSVQPLANDTVSYVIANKVIGALVVIAAVSNIYVEIVVSGFSEEENADKAALEFLNYYRSIIK